MSSANRKLVMVRPAMLTVWSFFQHGNNSGKRDTVAFHGACNECSTNVDDLRISNTILIKIDMLSFSDMYDTLRLAGNK